MGLFSIELNSMEDLLLLQLEDLYDAEKRLTEALPKMADAAHCPELQQAFRMHLQETEGHVRRLEQIFQELNREPTRETCAAMKGLISEGSDMISAQGNCAVKDAALIAAAQRVEHYEMAGYGTVRTLARQLGREQIADLLQQTLDEEGNADKILTEIAESSVNAQASRAR
jgi:ferritin-like metal-binding protein YciE